MTYLYSIIRIIIRLYLDLVGVIIISKLLLYIQFFITLRKIIICIQIFDIT